MLFVVLFLPTPNKQHGFFAVSQQPGTSSWVKGSGKQPRAYGVRSRVLGWVYGFEFGTGFLGFRARVEVTQSISVFRYSLESLETAVEVGVC